MLKVVQNSEWAPHLTKGGKSRVPLTLIKSCYRRSTTVSKTSCRRLFSLRRFSCWVSPYAPFSGHSRLLHHQTPRQCLVISCYTRTNIYWTGETRRGFDNFSYERLPMVWWASAVRRNLNARAYTQAKQKAIRDRPAVTSWLLLIPLGSLAHIRDQEDKVCKTMQHFGYKNSFKSQTGPLEWPIQ